MKRTFLLTPKQASEKSGKSKSTLQRWADDGVIESVKTKGGHRRYILQSLEACFEKSSASGVASSLSDDERKELLLLRDRVAGLEKEVVDLKLALINGTSAFTQVIDAKGSEQSELVQVVQLGGQTVEIALTSNNSDAVCVAEAPNASDSADNALLPEIEPSELDFPLQPIEFDPDLVERKLADYFETHQPHIDAFHEKYQQAVTIGEMYDCSTESYYQYRLIGPCEGFMGSGNKLEFMRDYNAMYYSREGLYFANTANCRDSRYLENRIELETMHPLYREHIEKYYEMNDDDKEIKASRFINTYTYAAFIINNNGKTDEFGCRDLIAAELWEEKEYLEEKLKTLKSSKGFGKGKQQEIAALQKQVNDKYQEFQDRAWFCQQKETIKFDFDCTCGFYAKGLVLAAYTGTYFTDEQRNWVFNKIVDWMENVYFVNRLPSGFRIEDDNPELGRDYFIGQVNNIMVTYIRDMERDCLPPKVYEPKPEKINPNINWGWGATCNP